MGISQSYGTGDPEEGTATIRRALELGVTFLDTADAYGPYTNEELVGHAIHGQRDRVFLATKFGFVDDPVTHERIVDGTPAHVRDACVASLRRLDVPFIDLYYLHRVDPRTPIEETVGAMAELVEAGRVKHLGLSEVSAETLRRAQRIHRITAVQSEYSLWTRDPEREILGACRELGVGFVPFSPLGRGFFSGRLRNLSQIGADDFRRTLPRFSQENFSENLALLTPLEEVAQEKHCTLAQLALAWLLAQGDFIVPIPGTKRRAYLEENLGALDVRLSSADMRRVEQAVPPDAFSGPRYGEAAMTMVNR